MIVQSIEIEELGLQIITHENGYMRFDERRPGYFRTFARWNVFCGEVYLFTPMWNGTMSAKTFYASSLTEFKALLIRHWN